MCSSHCHPTAFSKGNVSCFVFILSCLLILSCSKDKDKKEALQGEWTFKSQTDDIGGIRGYIRFGNTPSKKMNFAANGKVYSDGVVTPTWIFLPASKEASYYVKNNIITIGDSIVTNGAVVYTNLRIQFKILHLSQNLLVVQHMYRYLDPVPPVTVDSLVR